MTDRWTILAGIYFRPYEPLIWGGRSIQPQSMTGFVILTIWFQLAYFHPKTKLWASDTLIGLN